jgi:hypothetical protein
MISRLPENEKKDAGKNSDGLLMVFEIEHGGESLARFSFPRAQMAPYSRYFASEAFEMQEATPKNMHAIQVPCSSLALSVALREKTFHNHISKWTCEFQKRSSRNFLSFLRRLFCFGWRILVSSLSNKSEVGDGR